MKRRIPLWLLLGILTVTVGALAVVSLTWTTTIAPHCPPWPIESERQTDESGRQIHLIVRVEKPFNASEVRYIFRYADENAYDGLVSDATNASRVLYEDLTESRGILSVGDRFVLRDARPFTMILYSDSRPIGGTTICI